MEKIYAIINKDGIVINTINLDLETSTWTPPEGCAMMEAGCLGIGDVFVDGEFQKIVPAAALVGGDPIEKLKEFLAQNPDVHALF